MGRLAGESLERGCTLLVAAASLLLAASMLLAPPWAPAVPPAPFPMVNAWLEIVRLHRLDPIASLLPMVVAIDALLAAGLALALSLHRGATDAVRFLRRGLALGALAALYLFHIRVGWTLAGGVRVASDVIAYAIAARAVMDLCVFVVSFPQQPDGDRLLAFYREQSRFRPVLGTGRLRARFHASVQRLFGRLSRSLAEPMGSDAQVARAARRAARWLSLSRDRRVHALAITLSAVAGVLFALRGGERFADFVAGLVPTMGVFVPMLGFAALAVNYRFGSDDDRRRIGWIYFGPVAAFTLLSVVYWVLGAAMVPALGGEGRLMGLDIPALWVASMMLLVPLVVGMFLVGLAMAIFQRGAMDPRLAIRRGAVIALCGVLLTGLFVLIEGAVTSQVVVRFRIPDETGAVVAGTVAALVFAPVRNRVEAIVAKLVERLLPVRHLADGERREMSVVFVDMTGYTALSERDETTALLHAALLRKCAQAAADAFDGALVKSLGDGMMLRFDTPDAAMDAVDHLASAYAQGAVVLGVAPLPMHAGIHHGTAVLAHDGDVFGADVNLAARLCGAAGAGQVLLSADARQRLVGHQPARVPDVSLKNVAAPVRVFAATLPGGHDPATSSPAPLPAVAMETGPPAG